MLANMPPPSYRVNIPTGSEDWHEVAAPIFLAVAFFFALLWLSHFRTVRSSYGRAVILAFIGFAATSYTAWWIWTNRIDMVQSRSFDTILACEMPIFFFCFGLLFSLTCRLREEAAIESESSDIPQRKRDWRNRFLAVLVALGLAATLVIAPGRPDVWPALFAGFSVIALTIWFVVIAAVWCWAHYSDGADLPR